MNKDIVLVREFTKNIPGEGAITGTMVIGEYGSESEVKESMDNNIKFIAMGRDALFQTDGQWFCDGWIGNYRLTDSYDDMEVWFKIFRKSKLIEDIKKSVDGSNSYCLDISDGDDVYSLNNMLTLESMDYLLWDFDDNQFYYQPVSVDKRTNPDGSFRYDVILNKVLVYDMHNLDDVESIQQITNLDNIGSNILYNIYKTTINNVKSDY